MEALSKSALDKTEDTLKGIEDRGMTDRWPLKYKCYYDDHTHEGNARAERRSGTVPLTLTLTLTPTKLVVLVTPKTD